MRVLFVWTGVTSYMADCWRAFASRSGVELRVVVERVASGREFDAGTVLRGVAAALVDGDETRVAELLPPGWTPDVIFAVGWRSRVVRRFAAAYPRVPRVCCFDMPWRRSVRCVAARWVLRRYLRQFEGAFVPGERAARYARWLGFRRVRTGLFAIDAERFAAAAGTTAGPRRGFLYLGRFSSEKRVDLVRAAHARYREQGGSWPLDLYGGGGVFAPPGEVPGLLRGHGALVLASAFDPWPLVVLEAKAAGCPAIVSDRCGNAAELGAETVPYGDVGAMAAAMHRAERGEVAWRGGAAPDEYGCERWCERVESICAELLADSGRAWPRCMADQL